MNDTCEIQEHDKSSTELAFGHFPKVYRQSIFFRRALDACILHGLGCSENETLI